MANSARGSHVSPGVYMNEDELLYSSNSLGITTLGLAGETQKGPAFQPMAIDTWKNFVSTFGGTSPEKFKGSQYPKYELPYIAKSYLSQSDQLEVVRVLGLSGYNAGPAWVVTASKGNETDSKYVIAVLRSRGHYEKYRKTGISESTCECQTSDNDVLVYEVGERILDANNCQKPRQYNESALAITQYNPLYAAGDCETLGFSSQTGTFGISTTNLGRFKLQGFTGAHRDTAVYSGVSDSDKFDYAVSLNPNDKDYILDVLGTSPTDGDAPIYVESLYDVALGQLIENGKVNQIDSGLTFYQVFNAADFCGLEPVAGIISVPEENLTRRYLGQRYLADAAASASTDTRLSGITCHHFDAETGKLVTSGTVSEVVKVGHIYTVDQYVDSGGTRHYCYRDYTEDSISGVTSALSSSISATTEIQLTDKLTYPGTSANMSGTSTQLKATCVKNLSDGLYYRLTKDNNVDFINCNLNDYKSAYRYASTPWIVSNLMGDYDHVEMKKLFRFHTISDGNNANNEVKVSIENIRPDDGVFDVVVRDINDTDEYQIPLEKYSRCSLVPGSKNYIAYKIGSFDGSYEAKSKYITVECKESDIIANSVPAGFLGYPAVQFAGTPVVDNKQERITNPPLQYNTEYDVDTKNRKQYFGLSTRTGVDIDAFTFKGTAAYINSPKVLTHGFHLDSRLNAYTSSALTITVDGESGYKFDAVSQNNRTSNLTDIPVIGSEETMANTIYSYVNLRKFTVYFYGGFDGWDEFRDQRTNTDDFKASKYLGTYNSNSGEGYAFNRIDDPEAIGLNQNGITSDWYAYLAAYRQFANPESVDINIFATPGIDYVNNKLLVDEVVEMIEEERGDSIYVVTTPDKPSGAGDYADEMYTPDDAVYNLEDSELTSNYTCTYYPWVKYLDTDNNQYIYLPATKDAVRNFAQTDNITYPWFAPAGLSRGDVDCVRAHYVTKIADEDTLYEGRINPVKTFATDGVKLWGQKTLYNNDDSQLSRIAARRLMLRMKKLISTACRSLIFEPNDSVSKNTFLSTITPILDNIRSNRGISDYKVMVDDSTDASDRRELSVQIFFKPYAALEYISLNFVITPEQISFDDL